MKACNNVRFYIGDKNCYKKFICLVLINVVCCSSIKCMGNFYIIVFDIKIKKRKKERWTSFKPVDDTCFKHIFFYIMKSVLRDRPLIEDQFKMSHSSIRYVE